MTTNTTLPLTGHKFVNKSVRQSARKGLVAICCAVLTGALSAAPRAPGTEDPTLLSLEQLLDLDIQSASKFTQKASEAPSSVTVVSATDIQRLGYRKLADILNSIRGLYVTSDRNYSYLGVRGVGRLGNFNSGVLVMVDGILLNDPIYSQGSIGLEFPVDVDLIERVEFIPGPGSAIYGSNAFFGVINVITRNGKGVGGLELTTEAGSWGTYKSRATWGRRYSNDLDVLLSVAGYSSRGRDQYYPEFASPGASDGIARGLDYERAPNAFAKISWSGFTFEAAHRARTKGIPTASYQARFNDPDTRTLDAQTFAELRYDGNVARDLELSARINRGQYDYRGDYPYTDASTGTRNVNVDIANSQWWGGEIKLVSRAINRHKIVLGAEYLRNTRKDQNNYDLAPSKVYLDEHHASSQSGLYVQDEITLRPNMVVNVGLRYDQHSTFGAIVNPRLAFIYSLNPSITLKALYGKAYRAPNDSELFFSSEPLGWKGNLTLKPERITTQELVGEWRVSSLSRATLSMFRYRVADLITLTTDASDGFQVYENQGSAVVNGVQGEVERLWRDSSSVRVSYSLQHAQDQSGARLVNSPNHIAKFDAMVPLLGDKLRGGLALRYLGSRLSRSDARIGAYTTADLTLSSERLFPGVDVSFSIYNLFDKSYSDPVSDAHRQDRIVQDGRSVRLKITARF